jgi:hypothetical protein
MNAPQPCTRTRGEPPTLHRPIDGKPCTTLHAIDDTKACEGLAYLTTLHIVKLFSSISSYARFIQKPCATLQPFTPCLREMAATT